jgi:hypothetical protein
MRSLGEEVGATCFPCRAGVELQRVVRQLCDSVPAAIGEPLLSQNLASKRDSVEPGKGR